eukprot:4289294-Prymnesium_polylepis.1
MREVKPLFAQLGQLTVVFTHLCQHLWGGEQISGLPNDTFANTPRVSLGRRPRATLEVSATVSFGVPPFRSRALPRTLEEAVVRLPGGEAAIPLGARS